MKRSTFLVIALISFLCIGMGGALQARPLDEIEADGTIIIATEGVSPPFNFFQAGKLTGFEVEVGEAVAKKNGAES